MNGTNGHSTHTPHGPEQEAHQRLQRSPLWLILTMLGGLSGGGAVGYGAAQVQQVQRQRQDPPRSVPRRARVPLATEGCTCSPPCGRSQTCYRCVCVDVASGRDLRLRDLEEQVQRLAGGEEPLSAGAVR